MSLVSGELEGARVLDLFAGSGALGLEALSRGATHVDFVENGPAALHALKANVVALGARRSSRVFKRDAVTWIEAVAEGAYDVAFADPPYGSRKLDRVLDRWSRTPFARVLVVEHASDHELPFKGKRIDLPGPSRLTLLRAGARSPMGGGSRGARRRADL